jgi:hypothetical protein
MCACIFSNSARSCLKLAKRYRSGTCSPRARSQRNCVLRQVPLSTLQARVDISNEFVQGRGIALWFHNLDVYAGLASLVRSARNDSSQSSTQQHYPQTIILVIHLK